MSNPSIRGLSRRLSVLVALTSVCLGSSCASVQRQGDKAYESGDCGHALELYDEAAEAGNKDPELFHKAALCSLQLGDFGAVEKYYTLALRYGGGVEVARELAAFYVKTSNYVSAIRVYQYLLYQEADRQPVYNNMGTALMYAGQPFDAESYLMIAQQMDPLDPMPYINLGRLYDRHLKQPWLAINFYDCYDRATQGRARNGQMVRQRASELRQRYRKLYDEGAVKCGEVYDPGAPKVVANLKEVVDAAVPNEVEPPEDPVVDSEPSEKPDPNAKPPVIERQVTDIELPNQTAPELELGRRAFAEKRWAAAVGHYNAVPLSSLQAVDQKYLGIAYKEQANWAMAGHWLELASTNSEDEELVRALFDVYERAKDPSRLASVCERYGKSDKYEKIAREHCKNGGEN